jgi:hypothetical protein
MAADIQDLSFVAERSTKEPFRTWILKALFTPTGLVGKEKYRITFHVTDPNVAGLAGLGSAEGLYAPGDNGKAQHLQFTVGDAEAITWYTAAIADGGPANRIDLSAHVEVFDPSVSDQDPVAHHNSPVLELFVA